MPPETKLLTQFYVKVNGSDLTPTKMNDLQEIEVDVSFHMPSTAVLRFYDTKLEWTGGTTLDLGQEIEIAATDRLGTRAGIFKGIITNLEPEFVWDGPYAMYVVRAYDRSYKLHRGAQSATFVQMTDSDAITNVLGQAGLTGTVQSTSIVHEHIFRRDQSDYEFISMLARRNGHVVFYDTQNSKLISQAPNKFTSSTATLQYGTDLLEFRPRIALGGQVNEVKVAGWDSKQKQEVVGQSTSPGFAPTSTEFGRGPSLAQSKFSSAAKLHLADTPTSQSHAEAIAKAILDRMAGSDLTAEGVALGDAKLQPGTKLTISNLGKFSGDYFVTRVRHVFNAVSAYTTEFSIGGMNALTVASLLNDDPRSPRRSAAAPVGLQVALVTNSKDPDNLGRVKLKFPTLDSQLESNWARVASPGAGAQRGLMLIPEVNDEVLVGFENGDFDRPYVLGGLWNGSDAIPNNAATGSGGTVDVREFKSRSGHILRFTDTKGEEKIELIGKAATESLTIDSKTNKITLLADSDITITSKNGKVIVQGQSISIDGKTKVEVGAPTVLAEGKSQITLKGALAELSATGITKISGSMVNIN